jgi:unsaturated rhamnogalacturonyl hydrolase
MRRLNLRVEKRSARQWTAARFTWLACAASFWACGSDGGDVPGSDAGTGGAPADVGSTTDRDDGSTADRDDGSMTDRSDDSTADREDDSTSNPIDVSRDAVVDLGGPGISDSASDADGRGGTDSDGPASDGEAGSSNPDVLSDNRDSGPSAPDGSRGDGPDAAQPPFDRDAVRSILLRVAQYQLSLYTTTASNDWIDSAFFAGLMAAYRATQNASLLNAARTWSTQHAWDLHQSTQGPRFGDNQTCTQTYLEIFLLDPVPSNVTMIQKAQAAFDAMIAAPQPGRVDWWWCDALFMAPPALARLGVATGQTKYFDFMNTMYWDSKAFLFAPAQGLFWRDSKYFNTMTFWSRGNGWVVAGIPRILDYLPAADARRADYVELLRTMLGALAPRQGSDGLWRSDLLNPNAFPNPETSGTGFFTYGTAWAIGQGIVARDVYLPIVQRAWAGLVRHVDTNGRLGYVQNVGERPAAAGQTETHPYGVGAFLLAGSEVLKL